MNKIGPNYYTTPLILCHLPDRLTIEKSEHVQEFQDIIKLLKKVAYLEPALKEFLSSSREFVLHKHDFIDLHSNKDDIL